MALVTFGRSDRHADAGNLVEGEGPLRRRLALQRQVRGDGKLGQVDALERRLQLVGTGYRAEAKGSTLALQLGFSHPVEYKVADKVSVKTPSQTEIVLESINRQLVGQTAAEIRALRPPEPYKGKGVRYFGEQLRLKEAKKK